MPLSQFLAPSLQVRAHLAHHLHAHDLHTVAQSIAFKVFKWSPLLARMPGLRRRGKKIPLKRPVSIKSGFYFRTCRSYVQAGITYNYRLYNKFHKELKPTPRGARMQLSFRFPMKEGKSKQELVHRVLAFNMKRCNPKPYKYRADLEVHHKAGWKNSCWQKLVVWTKARHQQWHQRRR